VNVGELVDSTKKAYLNNFSTPCLAGFLKQGCTNHKELHFLPTHLHKKLYVVIFVMCKLDSYGAFLRANKKLSSQVYIRNI
jgi:hypothetical protein